MYVDNVKLSRFPLFLLNTSIQIRFWWKSFFFWNYKRSYISFTFYIDRHGPKLNSQFLAIFSQKNPDFPQNCGLPLVFTPYIFYIFSSYPRVFIWYISTKHISWEIKIFEVFQFSAIFYPKMTVFPYSAQSRFFIFVSSGVTVLKKVKMISVAIFLRFSCIFDRLTGL